ncbi:MAG: hypothetical protein ACYTBP_07755 [Planctomycetota bacterium]|jgi:hypothetical protein
MKSVGIPLKIQMTCAIFLVVFLLSGETQLIAAKNIDLSRAVIVSSDHRRNLKAAAFLQAEISRRSGISLNTVTSMPSDNTAVIVLGRENNFPCSYQLPYGLSVPKKAQGYAIWVNTTKRKTVTVYLVGSDDLGALFAVGQLIRLLDLGHNRIGLSDDIRIATFPATAFRGHQIAYRGLNNTTDTWNIEQYEQQIRDLIIFGTDTIELIPALNSDTKHAPHMKMPVNQMCKKLSVMIDEYGLDLWIYKSIFRREVDTPAKQMATLDRWKTMLANLDGLDAILVPGGDGSDMTPQELMVWFAKVKQVLNEVHPKATLWITHQSWSDAENQWFYNYLATEKPNFLEGVVYAPYGRTTIRELREKTPPKYKLRRYPDISHSTVCQYPVQFDGVFLNTLGREPINPLPRGSSTIFRAFEKYGDGFITYSDGVHDDLNKIIWSELGWNSGKDVNDILLEYGKVFFGDKYAEKIAEGLWMLESNWAGPIDKNEGIEKTLQHWREIVKQGRGELDRNWRLEMYLFRAMYDAYLQRKLFYEKKYETQANEMLLRAAVDGSEKAIANAKKALAQIDTLPDPVQQLRDEIEAMGLRLFTDIGMQLSMKAPYYGQSIKRGVVLDWIDFPLNNRRWLEQIRFPEILTKEDEFDRLKLIYETVYWEKPTPDAIYDDMGKVGRQRRLVRQKPWSEDPGGVESPTVEGYYDNPNRNNKLSHLDVAETRFGTPLLMQYDGLDTKAEYKLRVTYSGRYKPVMKLIADDKYQIHGELPQPKPIEPVEFDIPKAATADGVLALRWELVRGRGCQVGEVWLIKQ